MSRDSFIAGAAILLLVATGFIATLIAIERQTEVIKEAVSRHMDNAHIVVERHYGFKREKAGGQNE